MNIRHPARLALAAAMTLAFAAGGLLLPASVLAQEQGQDAPKTVKIAPSDAANSQPWVVNCTTRTPAGELSCAMTQVLISQQSNQRIVGATVFRSSESGPADLRLNLPHGILLQKGVDVWVDLAAPVTYPITIADQNGSYATIELTGPMIVSLQGGAFLNVAVTAANGDRVQFQLSLKGFTNAFAKL
jgi:invasion protein IalB